VHHTSSFPGIFSHISIQSKNRFGPRSEFFNRIDPFLPVATGRYPARH